MALVVFEDLPSTNTPLNAQNLNNNFSELEAEIGSITGNKVIQETITLTTSNWALNSSTTYYEYSVTNASITADHLVNVYMDIENQAKMTGSAYTQSYAGGFKIISDKLPTQNITATITYELTEGAS